MQTQSSTSMYMGSVDRQPLRSVWTPRQSSEPPIRQVRPAQPYLAWQVSPVPQPSSQQTPVSWETNTQTEMSRSFTSIASPTIDTAVPIGQPPKLRTPSGETQPSPGRTPAGWQPVQSPQSTPLPQTPATQYHPYQQTPATQYQPYQQTPVVQQTAPQPSPAAQGSPAQQVNFQQAPPMPYQSPQRAPVQQPKQAPVPKYQPLQSPLPQYQPVRLTPVPQHQQTTSQSKITTVSSFTLEQPQQTPSPVWQPSQPSPQPTWHTR